MIVQRSNQKKGGQLNKEDVIMTNPKDSTRRIGEPIQPTSVEDFENINQSVESKTSMRNLKQDSKRSISPDDFKKDKKIDEGKSSRNRPAISPSQRSTKMVSKGSVAQQQSKDDNDDLIEDTTKLKAEQDTKEELKSIQSVNSDSELMSQISKVKQSKKSEKKEPSIVSKEEVEEKTEMDKSSIRFEESEGDESEESEPDEEDSEETPRANRSRDNISTSNVNIEVLKKELQTEITRVEKKLGFTSGMSSN